MIYKLPKFHKSKGCPGGFEPPSLPLGEACATTAPRALIEVPPRFELGMRACLLPKELYQRHECWPLHYGTIKFTPSRVRTCAPEGNRSWVGRVRPLRHRCFIRMPCGDFMRFSLPLPIKVVIAENILEMIKFQWRNHILKVCIEQGSNLRPRRESSLNAPP